MINQHSGGERLVVDLVMDQIGKRFANVTALNSVALRLNPGKTHDPIDKNGADRSTLIEILAGVYRADSGSAAFDGHPLPLDNLAAIEVAGIHVIRQEFNLIPHLIVTEPVLLGQEYCTRWGTPDRRRTETATA